MVNYKNKFTFANALDHKLLVCAAGKVSNLAHSQCIGNSKIYHSLYIYFIFVNIFPAFLPPQLGRVFAGGLCNVIQGMEM